jgi:hypothetical protein
MDQEENVSGLVGITQMDKHARYISGVGDITKYLSSRYLNPGINGRTRFDLRKTRRG